MYHDIYTDIFITKHLKILQLYAVLNEEIRLYFPLLTEIVAG